MDRDHLRRDNVIRHLNIYIYIGIIQGTNEARQKEREIYIIYKERERDTERIAGRERRTETEREIQTT